MSDKLPFKINISITKKDNLIDLSIVHGDYSDNLSCTYRYDNKQMIKEALLREIQFYIEDNLS